MLRLTVSTEEYLMIGDDIKIVFLGGSKNHTRVMLDIPKDVNVVRSKVIEAKAADADGEEPLSHYYAVPDLPEKYRKKKSGSRQASGKDVKAVYRQVGNNPELSWGFRVYYKKSAWKVCKSTECGVRV